VKKKGIVLEIREQYLIVMTSGGEFCKVPAIDKPLAEGDEVEFTEVMEASKTARPHASWRRWTYAAACVLLLITVLPLWNMVFASAYAAVSIDINPSFEVEMDKQYEVTEVTALNQEAKEMLEDIDWKNRKITEVTKEILEEAREHGFLQKNHDVLIVPVGLKNPAASQELIRMIKQEVPALTKISTGELTITLMESTKEIREQAQKMGISAGRYALYDSLKRTNKDISPDKLRTLSISEVSSAIGGFEHLPNAVQYSKTSPPRKPKGVLPNPQAGKVNKQPSPAPVTPAKGQSVISKKSVKNQKENTDTHSQSSSSASVKHRPKLTDEEKKDKTKGVPKLITAETRHKAELQAKKDEKQTKEEQNYRSGYGQQQQQQQQGGRVIKEEEKERNEKYKEERQKNKTHFTRPSFERSEDK
jgi:hypothetical protein